MAKATLIIDTNIQELLEALDKAGIEVDNLEKETIQYGKRSKEAFAVAETGVEDVTEEIKLQTKAIREMEKVEEKYARNSKKLTKAEERQWKRVQADIRVARKEMEALQAKQKEVSKEAGKGTKIFKRLGTTMAGAFSVFMISRFLTKSIELYDIQAKAEARLSTALKGRMDIQERLVNQAKELQKATRFGDEQILEVQADLAKLLGNNEEAIRILTPLVLDFATAQELNLRQAGELVAKSVGSTTNALSRYGYTIEGAVGSTQRLDSAVRELNQKVGGQAVAVAKAGIGAWSQIRNLWVDMRERAGEFLAQGLLPTLESMKNLLTPTKSANVLFGNQKVLVEDLEKRISPMIDRYEELSQVMVPTNKEQEELQNIITEISRVIPSAVTGFDDYGKALGLSTEKVREYIEAQKLILRLRNKEAIQELTDELEKQRKKHDDTKKAIEEGGEVTKRVYDEATKQVKEFRREFTNEELIEFRNELFSIGNEMLTIERAIKMLSGELEDLGEGAEQTAKSLDILGSSNAELIRLEEEYIELVKNAGLKEKQAFQEKLKLIQAELQARRDAWMAKAQLIRDEIALEELRGELSKDMRERIIADIDAFLLKAEEAKQKAKEIQDAYAKVFELDEEEFIDDIPFDTEAIVKEIKELEAFAEAHPFWEALGITDEEELAKVKGILNEFQTNFTNFINQIVSQQVEASSRLVDDLNTRIAETQRMLDIEADLKAQGLANNYDLEKENLENLQGIRDQAVKDRERDIKLQRTLGNIEMGINLAVSATQILREYTKIPLVGIALAGIAIATLFALFANALTQSKSAEFGEGGEITEGKSHKRGGTMINAEKGEFIINKISTEKYRPLLEAINNDEFERMWKINRNIRINNEGSHQEIDLDKSKRLGEIADLLRRERGEILIGDGYYVERRKGRFHKVNIE